uniref:Uncharacterized protein n=1 Tax=Anguilla anguilla TaxID=7936 RepID=A0A0E9WFB2_ANGAN
MISPKASWTLPDFLIWSFPISPSEKSDRTGAVSLATGSRVLMRDCRFSSGLVSFLGSFSAFDSSWPGRVSGSWMKSSSSFSETVSCWKSSATVGC